jgi:hypothetical protein
MRRWWCPTYGAATTEAAVEAIGALFPGRRAVGIGQTTVLFGRRQFSLHQPADAGLVARFSRGGAEGRGAAEKKEGLRLRRQRQSLSSAPLLLLPRLRLKQKEQHVRDHRRRPPTRLFRRRSGEYRRVSELVREAAGKGAKLILPPELFEGHYFCRTQDEAHFGARCRRRPSRRAGHAGPRRELGVYIPTSFFEATGTITITASP